MLQQEIQIYISGATWGTVLGIVRKLSAAGMQRRDNALGFMHCNAALGNHQGKAGRCGP
jgi:hypothetical protein